MYVIDNQIYKHQIDIKKSTFISIAKNVNSKEELNKFLNEYQDVNATHNCYAYKIGIENQMAGYSDNGEPKGTAGMPIFNIIEKHDLTNIVILVIRYYGGVKLGAGPLMRTYSKSANELVDTIKLHEINKYNLFVINFPIQLIKEVENIIHNNNLELIDKNFSTNVTFKIKTPIDFELSFISDEIKIINVETFYS